MVSGIPFGLVSPCFAVLVFAESENGLGVLDFSKGLVAQRMGSPMLWICEDLRGYLSRRCIG